MKAVDTNILIRFLTNDDETQAGKVRILFKQYEVEKKELFIPFPIILELIWVLGRLFKLSRDEIIMAIDLLTLMPIFNFEKISVIKNFLLSAKNNTFDLADLLIAYSAQEFGCEAVITFGKKAARSDLFELLN